ncbi:MAG: Rad52/Rad22 family DNA repair protein [Synechococcaceae cyanobacterium]
MPATASPRPNASSVPEARAEIRSQSGGVTSTARLRVTITAGGLVPLVREGSGAGHGIDVDLAQAHESALKDAENDAMEPQARKAIAGADDLREPVRTGSS